MTTPLHARTACAVTLLASLALAAPNNSYGGAPVPDKAWPKVECVSLEQLNNEIRWCTDNTRAVAYAEDCSKRMAEAWDEASRELKQLQAGGGSQSADFLRTGAKYRATIDRMAYLTGQVVRNADLIARYPEVMADYPGRTSAEDSLPCYQNAFAKIQKIVTQLDTKGREGVQALVVTSELEERVASRTGGLDSSSLVKPVSTAAGDSAPERLPASSKHSNGASDITGTEKKKDKL